MLVPWLEGACTFGTHNIWLLIHGSLGETERRHGDELTMAICCLMRSLAAFSSFFSRFLSSNNLLVFSSCKSLPAIRCSCLISFYTKVIQRHRSRPNPEHHQICFHYLWKWDCVDLKYQWTNSGNTQVLRKREQVFMPDKGRFHSTEMTPFCGLLPPVGYYFLYRVGVSGHRSLRVMGPETSLSSTGLQLTIVVKRNWTPVLSSLQLLPPVQFWLHPRGAG